jgi:hypothetical protein
VTWLHEWRLKIDMASRAEIKEEWQGTASGAQSRREIRQLIIGSFQPIKQI